MKYFDRIKETATTTGTGDFTLAGAATGFRTFASVLATSDTCYYCISGGSEWEVGLGTYSAANTLTRTTVLSSSNSDAAVDFSTGTKDVFLTVTAQDFKKPGFSATKNDVNQTAIATGTYTKVTATTEEFDAEACYDAANSKLQPSVPGYYLVSGCITFVDIGDQKICVASIYKNGAAYKSGATTCSGTQYPSPSVSVVVYLNGSTDYVELYGYHNHGSNRDIYGGTTRTYFQAVKVA